jgi:hypothetical protein
MNKKLPNRLFEYRQYFTTLSSGFIVATIALSKMFEPEYWNNLLIISIVGFSLSVFFGLFSYKNMLQFEIKDEKNLNTIGKLACNDSGKRMALFGNFQHWCFLISFVIIILYLIKNII